MDVSASVNINVELTYRRQQVILQMRELEAATETITRAFEDEDFQNEAASARYKNRSNFSLKIESYKLLSGFI